MIHFVDILCIDSDGMRRGNEVEISEEEFLLEGYLGYLRTTLVRVMTSVIVALNLIRRSKD